MEDKMKIGNDPLHDHDEYERMLDRLVEETRRDLSKKLGFDIPETPETDEPDKENENESRLPVEMPPLPLAPEEGVRVAANFNDKEEQPEDTDGSVNRISLHRRKFFKAFIISAAAVLLCLISFYGIRTWEEETRRRASAGTVAFCAKDSTFRLSDGSEITLQASTELSVDKSFGKKDRVVALSGMGYMHAATDSMRPYTVNMPHGLALTVRGTSFNINAYPGNSRAEITVTSGCVLIRNTKTGEVYGEFHKGDRFIYDAATGSFRRQSGVDLAEATAWMKGGRIVLCHATLEEFKETIFRRYGKEVEIEGNAIPKDADIMWESSGRHPKVEDVAEGVSFLYGGRSEISGDKVIIRPEV